jgi:hypothetical protein
MTITTWVDLGSKEVEVSVTSEDIRTSIQESFDAATRDTLGEPVSRWDLVRALKSMAAFLDALSEEHIATLGPEVRKTVAKFLAKHAERFRVAKSTAE